MLATSELVANAVRHARGPLGLEIRRTAQGWVVAVTDGASTEPRPSAVDELAENGRGLLIVTRTTDRHGWAPSSRGKGKVVWVELWEDSA